MLILIWTAVLFGVIYIYLKQIYSRFSRSGVKYFKPLPLIGNMGAVLIRKVHFVDHLEKYYKEFPNDRFVGRYEFTMPTIVVRDLELIKRVTIKDFEYFTDHRGFSDAEVEPIFGRNLFTLKGSEWRDMRSTLSPAFTSSKIRVMVPFMEEVGNQMMASLKRKIESNGGKAIELDIKDLTTRYSNDVIATCAFGLKVDSYTDENNTFYEMGKVAASFKLRQMLLFIAYAAFPSVVKASNKEVLCNNFVA